MPLVKPPTAAPVSAASAEMMEAFTGAVPNQPAAESGSDDYRV
jgi:hypothetical protein